MANPTLTASLRQHFVEMSMLHFCADHGFLSKSEKAARAKALVESAHTIAVLIADAPHYSQSKPLQDARTALTHDLAMACETIDFRRDSYYQPIRVALMFLELERAELDADVNAAKRGFLEAWLAQRIQVNKPTEIAHRLDEHLFMLLHAGESDDSYGTDHRTILRERRANGQIARWMIEILGGTIESAFNQVGMSTDEALKAVHELMLEIDYALNEREPTEEEKERWTTSADIVRKARYALFQWDNIVTRHDNPGSGASSPANSTLGIASALSISSASIVAQQNVDVQVHVKNVNERPQDVQRKAPKAMTMDDVERRIDVFALLNVSILIVGETGTGKEVAARAIHAKSERKKKVFSPINCASLLKDRIDADLFGYEKGAFTGADNPYPGILRNAEGGIVFLDEIGDLPESCWANLLRFLQDGIVRPLKGQPIKVDVRILAATNRWDQIREDVLYRFDEFIFLPPLRERLDISALALTFYKAIKEKPENKVKSLRFTKEEANKLSTFLFDWPGNIRQLEKAVNSAYILHKGDRDLTAEDVLGAAQTYTKLFS